MDLGITGRVAFVSGGSKGVGRAISEVLAREGCRVAVVARGQQAIDETVETIRKAGGQAVGISADLYTREGVNEAVAKTQEAFAMPDIAISNVHGPGHGDFFDLTAEDFAQACNELVLSVVYLTQAVAPHMMEQKWGRLINIGSGATKEPPGNMKHILANTARASVVSMNKSLANEFGPYGITVNTIATGFIDTGDRLHSYMQMAAEEVGMTKEAYLGQFISAVPLRRAGKPEEMAAMVAFLASEGGGYTSGNLMSVDGGLHRSAW